MGSRIERADSVRLVMNRSGTEENKDPIARSGRSMFQKPTDSPRTF
jgi:hypothetical protein